MGRKFFTVLFLFTVFVLKGQPKYNPDFPVAGESFHAFGDAGISVSPTFIISNMHDPVLAKGLRMRLFIGERFSFDTGLMLGKDYLHVSPGMIGVPVWFFGAGMFLNAGNESNFSIGEDEKSLAALIAAGALMFLTVEHFTYHIPILANADFSPYVSLLRIKFIEGKETPENPKGIITPLSFAAGLEFNYYIRRFIISPYVEFDMAWSGRFGGLNTGIYFGLYLPDHR
jgi:hypothetical protein